MSELLQNWLNNEVGLSTNVTSFEKDFANGYLFGEILHKFRQQDDFESFDNRHTYEAKLANFKRLEPTFKAIGIKFCATQSNAMMAGERGASLRLLYQLKMATERLLLTSESAAAAAGRGATASQGAPTGGGVIKGIRIPRDRFDTHEKGFFEHRLRATCLNVKQARLDKVTKKFEEERHKQEHVAKEMDRVDQLRVAEQRDIHRFSLRERMRVNMAAKDEWNRMSVEAWEGNMHVRRAREAREVNFEYSQMGVQDLQRTRVRDTAAAEVRDGVDAFEAGLSTLGLTRRPDAVRSIGAGRDASSSEDEEGGEEAEQLLSTTTPAANARELVEAIQARMPNSQELEQEAGLFLQKIKESKKAGSVARKERERRRRRVLVELQRGQDLLEESKLEEVLLEKLSRESAEEKRISYSVWRTHKYEDVIASNRQLRNKEYVARRKADQREALQRDQDLLQEMLETMGEQQERERVRYRAIERGRRARCMAQLSEDCEGILELISSMAFAGLQQEQLTDRGEADETLWREWTQLFVEGVPVTSSESPAESVATMYPLMAVPPPSAPPLDDDTEPADATTAASAAILDDAAFKDFLQSHGQWELRRPPGSAAAAADGAGDGGDGGLFDAAAEVARALDDEGPAPSYLSRLCREVDLVDGRPVNYRLGVIVAALLDREYARPPLPDPPPMPDVPLRLVITGKPFAGTKTLARRLADDYNLQIVEVDACIRECLLLSKRPDVGTRSPIDLLSINAEVADEQCRRCEEEGNPYVRQLQDIGYELQQILDRGEPADPELYVHMITTKIRSLFPERMPDRLRDGDAACAAGADALENVGVDAAGMATLGGGGSQAELQDSLGDPSALEGANADQLSAATSCADGAAAALGGNVSNGALSVEAVNASFGTGGWALVNFPDDAQRLQLFERFLSGWVAPSATPMLEVEAKKAEAGLLAPKPHEEPPPFERVPGGYDLHIRLNVKNDEVVRRAVGRRLDPATSLTYHLEDSPPCTKNLIYERLVPVDDLANSMGSLTNRTHSFDIAQPEVEVILSHFGPFPDAPRFRIIDAQDNQEGIHESVEEQVALLLERKRAQHAKRAMEQAALATAAADGHRSPSNASGSPDLLGGVPGVDGDGSVVGGATTPLSPPPDVTSFGGATPEGGQKPGEGSSDGAGKIEEVPIELVEMTDLPKHIERLEEKVFKLLLQEWQELQDRFTVSIKQLFCWHRSHLTNFRKGMHGLEQRFLQFVGRVDDKQTLVDNFVERLNSFSAEYPDMRKQDTTKEELHQQADDLYEQLQQKVNVHKEEHFAELDAIMQAQWVESHIEVICAQIQQAVRLEANRYDAACQLLTDFYHAAIGMGLPESREPRPKVDAITLAAEDAAHTRLRQKQESGDSGTATWEFPFLRELMSQAKAGLSKPIEYCRPTAASEKKEEAAPKAKAKGRTSPPPDKKGKDTSGDEKPADEPTPPLFIDLQQALLAERVHYLHRLTVIQNWAERRLLEESLTVDNSFMQLRDWILLRKKKELDSCVGLIEVIKDHIESEDRIDARLTFQGAHLHRHPNIRLRAPAPEPVPLPLECTTPFRWTIDQLEGLHGMVVGAAHALRPGSRVIPKQSLVSLLVRLAQTSDEESAAGEQPQVPQNWLPCDAERFQQLCAALDHIPRDGTVDCVELLLHIGLMHSPLGWPSLKALLRVREILEAEVPIGASWPDFFISVDTFERLPLFEDPEGAEARLAQQHRPKTATVPAPFDRSGNQLRWIGRVLRSFPAPLRQLQVFELGVAWHEYYARSADELRVNNRMLDDTKSSASNSPHPQGAAPDSPTGTSEEAGPTMPAGPPPRPTTPAGLPERREAGAISARQLLSYLCLGSSLEDGLKRAAAVLGPTASASAPIPVADLHAILLQLGARPTPPAADGDGRPRHPSLSQLCEELGLDPNAGTISVADIAASTQVQRLAKQFGYDRRHCRSDLERLFPKGVQPRR